MSSSDRTPTERPKKPQIVTVAGKFAMHTVTGRWSKSMCRGSGETARTKQR